jgi:hypothetical protein
MPPAAQTHQLPKKQMKYSINTFQTLLHSHPTDSLDFLSSQEGGNFRVVGDARYRIVRYDKKATDMSSSYAGWMRSTVWDSESNLPMCVSPPKANKEEYPPCSATPLLVQDFVEGTMVNLIVPVEGAPFLVTRSQIGASGNFYSQRSFADLFADAVNEENVSIDSFSTELKTLFSNEKKPHSYFASFVVQHPEHRVVARVQNPRLYAISAGCVSKDGSVKFEDITQSCSSQLFKKLAVFEYPITGFKEDSDTSAFMNSLQKTKGWFWQGLTYKSATGNRWRMRNTNYMTLRALRGSEALPLDRWLRLRSRGLVLEYLKHYREERQIFWDFEQRIRSLTNDVYNGYVDVHKAHTKKLTDFPKNISPCIFRLHAHYLEHLKPEGESVRLKDCIELINNMSLLDQRRLMTPPRPLVEEAVA